MHTLMVKYTWFVVLLVDSVLHCSTSWLSLKLFTIWPSLTLFYYLTQLDIVLLFYSIWHCSTRWSENANLVECLYSWVSDKTLKLKEQRDKAKKRYLSLSKNSACKTNLEKAQDQPKWVLQVWQTCLNKISGQNKSTQKGYEVRLLCPIQWHWATCWMGAILCRFTQQWQWIITIWSPSTCWSSDLPICIDPPTLGRNKESYPGHEEQQSFWSVLNDYCGSSPGGGEVMAIKISANTVHKFCVEGFT